MYGSKMAVTNIGGKATVASVATGTATLAYTGVNVAVWLLVGFALLIGGLLLVRLAVLRGRRDSA